MNNQHIQYRPRILAINPYVYDFKCYDEWRRPLGLYLLCEELKNYNIDIEFIDIMDRYDDHFHLSDIKVKKYHTGHYYETSVERPALYKSIPKSYRAFGIPEKIFLERLTKLQPIDLVLITSKMTYWYPGVFKTIKLVKSVLKDVPVVLGGTYATLCPEHAKQNSGADYVISGKLSVSMIEKILSLLNISKAVQPIANSFYYPPYLKHFGNLIASFGCPHLCTYCASHFLQGNYRPLGPDHLFRQFINQYNRGVRHFAFYDDALLINFDKNLKPFLKKIIDQKYDVTFHAPNGLHARLINKDIANLLIESNFKTIRLGYESHQEDIRKATSNKVTNYHLKQAIKLLKTPYSKYMDIGVNLLWGLHDQKFNEIKNAIEWIFSLGAKPKILNLSPIPHTQEFVELAKIYPILNHEPLSHNDSYFNLLCDPEHYEKLEKLRTLTRSQGISYEQSSN